MQRPGSSNRKSQIQNRKSKIANPFCLFLAPLYPDLAVGFRVATMNQSDAKKLPHALWPRLLFILWLAWVLALLYMGRGEWGRARPLPAQEREAAPVLRTLDLKE